MSADLVRKRDLPFRGNDVMHEELWFQGSQLVNTNKDSGITGRQVTISRDNWDWTHRERLRKISREAKSNVSRHAASWGLRQDAGAPFETTKHEYEDDARIISTTHLTGSYRYSQSGPLYAKSNLLGSSDSLWPVINTMDMSNDMIMKGTTAIANTIPTNPAASTAQFLGELREGLPKLPGAKLVGGSGPLSARGADEYLNYQFGLAPLIKDVQDIGHAVQSTSRILAQLRRDSGRLVRRRFDFPVDRIVDTPVVQSTSFYGAPSRRTGSTGAYIAGGQLIKERVTETRTWFSGAYTYFYAEGDNLLGKLRRAEQNANALLGLRITPELAWELTPWSWAVDWLVNLGDVIHNLSAFTRDGLVMPWGYVMQTKSVTDTYRLSGLNFNSGPQSVSTYQRFKTTVKKRVKATPYGFGLDTGAFTERQWAILAALGVSRASRQL